MIEPLTFKSSDSRTEVTVRKHRGGGGARVAVKHGGFPNFEVDVDSPELRRLYGWLGHLLGEQIEVAS